MIQVKKLSTGFSFQQANVSLQPKIQFLSFFSLIAALNESFLWFRLICTERLIKANSRSLLLNTLLYSIEWGSGGVGCRCGGMGRINE
ncbi:MAG UNVERIFIED_CONTAM: hypothetical protein LVR29_15120 [Microcystis novacekii LVE1205-3]